MSTLQPALHGLPGTDQRPAHSSGWLAIPALITIGLYAAGAKTAAVLVAAATAGITILLLPDSATLLMAFILYTNAAVVAIRFHGIPRAAAAATVAILLVPLFHYLVVQRKGIIVTRAVPLIVLFLVIQLAGIVVADNKELAISVTITTFAEGLILYALIVNVIRSAAVLRAVVWTLLLAGLLLGGASTYQQLTGDFRNNLGGFAQANIDDSSAGPAVDPDGTRSAGPIGEKNYYAQFLLMLLPLALLKVIHETRWPQRLAAGAAAGSISLAIAFTASRGAAIAGAIMFLAMIYWRQVNWRHLVLIMAAALMIVIIAPKFRERLFSIVGLINVLEGQSEVRAIDKSTQGRLSEMVAAVLVFVDQPVLGVGPGNFPLHFLDKADALGFQVHGEERLAHCAVLEIAAEHGILGLCCIFAILFVSFRDLAIARQVAADPQTKVMVTAFLLSMVALVASSLFLSFAYVRYYYFMLALAAVSSRIAMEEQRAHRQAETSRA